MWAVGLAASEPHRELRLRLLACQLLGVDLGRAQLAELLAGQRHPGRLRDPAPVRVAAEQRRLDQRRVGDRPRDPLRLLLGRPPRSTSTLPTRVAPSPSATTSSASCSSTASRRPSGIGRPADPVACSRTVSLVLIWPSTVIRSKDVAVASRRVAIGVGDARRRSARSRAGSRSRAPSSRRPLPAPRP